jgi:hypothetical protein
MAEDPKKPSPQETFRSGIKAVVGAANSVLGSVEQVTEGVRKPASSTWHTVQEQSSVVADKAKYTYQRRHEFAPQLIGGSAILGGGIMALRRGKIAGALGAVIAGGAAYAVVYDELDFTALPDMIFGKKE